MRQLFLVRHAQAETGKTDQSDFERALTAKGRIDAAALGAYFAKTDFMPQKILVSAARRTHETFCLFNNALAHGEKMEIRNDIYNADFTALQNLVGSAGSAESLMIVGHNPGMHALAMYYAETSDKLTDFPPATLCVLGFEKTLQRRAGKILALHMPAAD